MNKPEKLLVAGLATMSFLGATSCGTRVEGPPTVTTLAVNCDQNPGQISALSFAEIPSRNTGSPIAIELDDDEDQSVVWVSTIGRVTINGNSVNSDDAGKVMDHLAHAELIAGVPQHGRNDYYAGDEGMSLACNGATPAGEFTR